MCKYDRIIRVILGIVIFVVGFYYKSWWGLIGLIPFLTGLVGLCPIYMLIGKQSCPIGKKDKDGELK